MANKIQGVPDHTENFMSKGKFWKNMRWDTETFYVGKKGKGKTKEEFFCNRVPFNFSKKYG